MDSEDFITSIMKLIIPISNAKRNKWDSRLEENLVYNYLKNNTDVLEFIKTQGISKNDYEEFQKQIKIEIVDKAGLYRTEDEIKKQISFRFDEFFRSEKFAAAA